MRISVVVPTYRRPDALGRGIEALAGQRRLPDEVIVVFRRDDPVSRELLAGRSEPWLRTVPIEVEPGRPGFVAALNAGAIASTGDVVCFTDDDTEPWPDWLERIEAAFESDPALGALGGRDWVYHGDDPEPGEETVVGTVSWWGRAIGRHHLGVGPAREVSVLKGANMSVRGELIREVGFDRRLRGITTEHHSELELCLRLRRRGFRVVYDPAVAVDHRPRARPAEGREFGPEQVRNAAHNETLALLEHLSAPGAVVHVGFAAGVGTRSSPGLAQAVRLQAERRPRWDLLGANLDGRRRGLRTLLRVRRLGPNATAAPAVLAVPHVESARLRAEQLLDGVEAATVRPPGRGLRQLLGAAAALVRERGAVLYLVDIGRSTAPLALLGRLLGRPVVVDLGDAGFALARSLGERGFLGLLAVGCGESLALRCADEVVVRGRLHAPMVPGRATQIPDLPPPDSSPVDGAQMRREQGLDGRFVVGLVGSIVYSPRRRTSYGWDLIEAMPRLDPAVAALVVGDGSGLERLRRRAQELGVADRCRFVGAVPQPQVAAYVAAMDAAVSTQTNDVVGRVRTTGKLPLYLACGCPVLATDVGEASFLLGPLGWTLPYSGVVDRRHPERLAAAIEAWRLDPQGAPARRASAIELAAREFDPEEMRRRLAAVITRADAR